MVSVASGDSMVVEVEKVRIRIHLAGMDAPEMAKGSLTGQPFAAQAKQELTNIALNSKVTVLIYRPHEYDGYYAIVLAESGVCLNTYMVESGFAVLTPIGDEYYRKRLEWSYGIARQNKWGIWSLPKMETPFEYRQRTKKRHLD